jgi:hypothetical protein
MMHSASCNALHPSLNTVDTWEHAPASRRDSSGDINNTRWFILCTDSTSRPGH